MSSNLRARNLVILLGSTTTVMATTIISPAQPAMAQAFADVPNADFLVRLTLTMPALLIALGAPLAGYLLDHWGRKPVLIVALLIYTFAGSAGYFLDSLPAILASRALLGVAVAGTMSGFTTLLMDYFQERELNRFLGLQAAVMGIGGMVILLAAGVLAEFGWRYSFLAHAFALAILLGVVFFINEPDVSAGTTSVGEIRTGFPWRNLLPVYATAFVAMVIFNLFLVQIPFYLSASGGVSSSQVGLALSMQGLSSVFVALNYGRLRERYSFQALFGLMFLTFAASSLILVVSAGYLIVITSLLISGLGIGLFPTNSSGWVAVLAPAESRGKAVGVLTSMVFMGQFFSPIFAQPLNNQFGLAGTFAFAAVAALLMALLFALFVFRQTRVSPKPSEV